MNTRIVAAAVLTFATAACMTNDRNSGLVVQKVVNGTFTPGNGTTIADSCIFNAGDGESILPNFNPAAANEAASAGFVVQNQLIDPSTLNPELNTDSTTFTPHQAVVDYEIVGGPAVARQIIPVTSSTVQGGTLVAVVVPLFSPAAVAAALTADSFVRTSTRIEGKLDDGSTVSTSQHDYLIHFCPTCGNTNPCF